MPVAAATRRSFLATAAAGVSAAAQPPAPAALPTVKFGNHQVTRLIMGTNPLWGYSHTHNLLDKAMREWMTPERRVETVLRAERAGIRTWQLHYTKETIADYQRARDLGWKGNWFLLSHGDMQADFGLIAQVAKLGPIGIAHHGNATDDRFRAGEMHIVREFTKRARDAGVLVGVSMHNPFVLEYIEEKGWDVDYYMTCFYQISRTRDEARALLNGEAPLGETFLEKDPVRMTQRIRATRKPCLGFKILGAGRQGYSTEMVEKAFQFALSNIKPSDALIVGMWPKFKDEPVENAAIVRKLLAQS